MDFTALAHKRRSIRKYEPRKVGKELIDKIIEVTLTAPSSKNLRTTRIVVSEDAQALETISRMRSRGAAFVKNAAVAFFIMGDSSQTNMWRENCAISATVLQFAAESLGLGSCWVQVFGRPHDDDDPNGKSAADYLRENIPGLPDFDILCVVAAGYPAEQHPPHATGIDSDKVFYL